MRDKGVASLFARGPNINISDKTPTSPVITKTNNNSIKLPEHWTKLVDEDSITVQLTAIGKPQQLYVERIDNNVVYVQSEENRKNISQLNYYYLIHAERIDVDKLEVEIEE